ncbi:MAG: ABC transporter permease [Eubacteriales bacterium]|jgi:D-methionine transport system permease protein|nr:ABC transporter permease [Eubacteriales bacterium]NCC81579.1 ABC transporter permease [Clostridia bacterium]
MDFELARIMSLIMPSLWETVYMVTLSTIFSVILGLPMGIIVVISEKGHIWEHKGINNILSYLINIFRSIPFIILIIILFPLARIVVGTSIGSTAAIVPLSIAASPFVARIVETSMKEIDYGIIEAALAHGASTIQIITKVMIKEAMPSLILGLSLTTINILGYSAMAGAIGGGGLGDLAIRYGYQRFQTDILIATVIILIIVVEVIQRSGNLFARLLDKRIKE